LIIYFSIERTVSPKLNPNANLSILLSSPDALEIAIEISRYSEILQLITKTKDSSTLVNYLIHLAKLISSAIYVLRVKDQHQDVLEARWVCLWSSKMILNSGIRMIGLNPIEAM